LLSIGAMCGLPLLSDRSVQALAAPNRRGIV